MLRWCLILIGLLMSDSDWSVLRRCLILIDLMMSNSDWSVLRWCLILIGLVMLTSVLVIMGQLLVDWGHGRAGGQVANLASRQGKLTFFIFANFFKNYFTNRKNCFNIWEQYTNSRARL